MFSLRRVVLGFCLLNATLSVRVKVVMHSDEDSRIEEEEVHTEAPETKIEPTNMPFIRHRHNSVKRTEEKIEYEEEKVTTTEKAKKQMHPNDMIFPLIYRQTHINSMFKFGENWYTWSTDKHADGTKGINYYVCYEEPKHCDEVGWDHTDSLPKCAFQIDSLLPRDHACINAFGVEPRDSMVCDGGEQMKVSDIVHSCGPRIRSLWRFLRVGRRPVTVAKPADVNSLVCDDEEECFVSIEYRIHHDRITFSLHEPSRGQTFKSALKREAAIEETTTTEPRHAIMKKKKEDAQKVKKFRSRAQLTEGKGVTKTKTRDENSFPRSVKNKIKVRDDVSEDISD